MRVDLESFEERYAHERDPWSFESSHYEQRKYAITIASLPAARYRRCFEPGCSIGVLTERLAGLADEVIALDASASAVDVARRRLADSPHTVISVGALPEMWPRGTFDLVVMSELGYYWDERELEQVVDRLLRSIEPGGHLVAVHWLGSSADHLLHGADVHRIIDAAATRRIVHHVDEEFVLDVWEQS
jgi:SAM-dependent methyltransferase